LAQNDSAYNLTHAESFMRLASGYATRAESLSLFGSYPLQEAQQLVDGLFGVPYDSASLAARFAERPPCLSPQAQITEGLYYFQGQVRKTRRVQHAETRRYVDLHPGEDALLRLLDGGHSYADLDRAISAVQAREQRMPVRGALDLLVQLDGVGALA
jgi:hypothetical protein